jgi:hypothetical protein
MEKMMMLQVSPPYLPIYAFCVSKLERSFISLQAQ